MTRSTSDGSMVSRDRRKPEFGVSEKDLPAIKGWKVGGKYQILLTVEQVSASKGSDYDAPISVGNDVKPKDIHNARFKILSAKPYEEKSE